MLKPKLTHTLALIVAAALMLTGCPKKDDPATPQAEPLFQHVKFQQGLGADQIEQQHPLTDAGRAELTPENVAQLEQWQIDQLYQQLDGGSIPEGPWQGRFFFAEGSGVTEIGEAFKILPSRVVDKLVDLKLDELTNVGEALWKGKRFFKEEAVLRNMIDHERIVERIFRIPASEVQTMTFEDREVALLFPAKLYCGKSLMDDRKESVIIDYAESSTIEGYLPKIDHLAAKDALNIRDEIRFVRPGFYLGLAYFLDQKLLLTFTLYNEEAARAGVTPEPECWDGHSPRPEAETTTEAITEPVAAEPTTTDEAGEG